MTFNSTQFCGAEFPTIPLVIEAMVFDKGSLLREETSLIVVFSVTNLLILTLFFYV